MRKALVRLEQLQAENARLVSEVERYKKLAGENAAAALRMMDIANQRTNENAPLQEALGGGVVLSAKEGHLEAMASCPLCGHAGHPHAWAAGRCPQADCRCVVVHVLVARMPAVTGTPSDPPAPSGDAKGK